MDFFFINILSIESISLALKLITIYFRKNHNF